MDEIVNKIIGLEKRAQAIVGEARERRNASEETIGREIEDYRNAAFAENRRKIGGYAARMNKEADDAVRKLEIETKKAIEEMRLAASERLDGWAGQLFDRIVGGDPE